VQQVVHIGFSHQALSRRVTWLALAGCCAFVIGASRWLTPSPTGVGTHTQLGLPPCGFLLLFDVPCPACGLTTAFAHLAHLQLAASLRAHPMGLPLFAGALLLLVVALHGALRARPLSDAIDALRIDRVALVTVGGLLATWVVRLLT
jgi:hypothetical protein